MDYKAFKKSEDSMQRFLKLGKYKEKRYNMIASFFAGKKGKLLDVGCHKGDLKNYLSQDIEYYGVDSCNNDFATYTKCDLNEKKLPFSDKYFNMINCSAVLEHIFYPYEILSELERVLQDDGICVISLPNDKSPNAIFSVIFGEIPDYDKSIYDHHWRFSLRTARDFVGRKFTILYEKPSFGPLYDKYLPFLKVKNFATEWFMVCKKKGSPSV